MRIAERDGWACWICGNAVDPQAMAGSPNAGSVDHIVPRSKGGANTEDNMRLAHRRCNTRRGSHMPELDWPTVYSYVDTTPLWPVLQRLMKKPGSGEIVAMLVDERDADALCAWLVEVATRTSGVAWSASVETIGTTSAIRLRAG